MNKHVRFSTLKGMTLTNVVGSVGDEEIKLTTDTGQVFLLYHEQDCCEQVIIEDVCGDYQDIIGSPILVAEEAVSHDNPNGTKPGPYDDSSTWTFYKIDTAKGGVTIRWCGTSNGYYSESVSFAEVVNKT